MNSEMYLAVKCKYELNKIDLEYVVEGKHKKEQRWNKLSSTTIIQAKTGDGSFTLILTKKTLQFELHIVVFEHNYSATDINY